MEVNDQLEAAAALPLGTKPPLRREYKAGRTSDPAWILWRKKNSNHDASRIQPIV
jgi:hypothetical protein